MRDRKSIKIILTIIIFVGAIFFVPIEAKAVGYTNIKAAVVNKVSVPLSVKAVSSSYNSIKTSWGAVTGANGYQVYRATSSKGTYTLVSTTTATSYNNTGLNTNSTYYYKVRAYKNVGASKVYSSFSSVVSSKPVPSVPSSVKAVSSSYKSIKTSWASVTGSNGYEVYRATSSKGTYTLVTTTTSTSYNNTGLNTNSTYYYKVRAYRMVGKVKIYSGFSSVVNSKPVPSVPTSVNAASASSASQKRIHVRWDQVTGAGGYEIYRATSSTGAYTLKLTTDSGYETLYEDIDVTEYSIYYYKVRAFTRIGNVKVYSGFSPVSSSNTTLTVPESVKAVSSSSNSNVKANMKWKASIGASGYEVYRYSDSTKKYYLLATTTGNSYNETGLKINSTYYYKIRAYTKVGTTKVYSDFSRELRLLTPKHPNALFRKNEGDYMNVAINGSTEEIGHFSSNLEIYIENSKICITLYDVGIIFDGEPAKYGVTQFFDLGVGIDVIAQYTGEVLYHKDKTGI